MRRIVFKQEIENLNVGKNTGAVRNEKWKGTAQALEALDNALRLAGNGFWPRVDRYTDIVEQIEVNDAVLRRLGALRDTIEKISDRSHETALTEYYLEMLYGFDAEPFIFLDVLAERLCDLFDGAVCLATRRLDAELCEADDDEPNWCVPVNAAAAEATKETAAWIKDVQLLRYRLSKAAEKGLEFL